MKKCFLLFLLLLPCLAVSAQNDMEEWMPDNDKILFHNIQRIMHMPKGTHIIYNGEGSSVFDALYTIEILDDKWTVYKGGTKSYFDRICSVERLRDGYKIYKDDSDFVIDDILRIIPERDRDLFYNIQRMMYMPKGTHTITNGAGNSVFDVLYTIEILDNKWTVYKGGSKSSFNVLYSVERLSDGYKIYRGDSNSSFNVIYTIKQTNRSIEIYNGSSVFNKLYSYERN